jgi:hypothetical protein
MAACALATSAHAAMSVSYESDIATGCYSSLAPWPTDGGFTIAAGVFADGFTPEPDNVAAWAAHWSPIGTTTWMDWDGDLMFCGGGHYADNETAFAIDSPIYLWGYDSQDLAGAPEWILLRNDAWRTLDASVRFGLQQLVTTGGGTTTNGVGSVGVGPSGAGSHFVTAVVPEPAHIALLLGLATLGWVLFGRRIRDPEAKSARIRLRFYRS